MSVPDILREVGANVESIRRLASSVEEISIWDKTMWGLEVTVALAGLVFAPPTGGWSLVLTVLGAIALAADMGKKVADVQGNEEIKAQIAVLQLRNEELLAEVRRRLP